MRAFRKRSTWILLALLLLPILASGLWFGRQVRQQRLDRALIQALKRNDSATAIALLDQGANANAKDKPYTPLTLPSLLADLRQRLHGKPLSEDVAVYPSAITFVYGPIAFGIPDTSIVSMMHLSMDTAVNADFVENKRASAPLVRALLAHGASLDHGVGNELLDYACICDDAEIVKILLQHRVDPNAPGVVGFPRLMCTQNEACARLLLEFGADANGRDSSGRTPLMCIDNPTLYPLLLAHHADPNAQDNDGKTALIHLFTSHYVEDRQIHTGMNILLQHGAKVSLKDHEGKTALDYARAGHANWMVEFREGMSDYDQALLDRLKDALRKEKADSAGRQRSQAANNHAARRGK